MTDTARRWTDYTPAQAAELKLDLSKDLAITAPLNENGERCPWPWEPQQLTGAPLGQYRCGYCMAMVVAGMPHIDYAPQEIVLTDDNRDQVAARFDGHRADAHYPGALSFEGPDGRVYARPGDTIRVDGYGEITVTGPEGAGS